MNSKPATYQIRLPKELLAEYLQIAKQNDKSPAGEIRDFMRKYIEHYKDGRRPLWRGNDLF